MSDHNQSRRSFIKKAAYIAPVVLTLKAAPSLAHHKSGHIDAGLGTGCEGLNPGNSQVVLSDSRECEL